MMVYVACKQDLLQVVAPCIVGNQDGGERKDPSLLMRGQSVRTVGASLDWMEFS